MYTEEELELLRTDPELCAMRKEQLEVRLNDVDMEIRELERLDALDSAMNAQLSALRNRDKLWKEWTARWHVYVEFEQKLHDDIVKLAEQLWDVEEKESVARLAVERQFATSLSTISDSETKARRYLMESLAWAEDWMASRDVEWTARRTEVEEWKYDVAVGSVLRRKKDEDEIAQLEQRVADVSSRLEAKKAPLSTL